MSIHTPIPRQTRQSFVTASAAQVNFGPFDFPLFDVDDVQIRVKAALGTEWTLLGPDDFAVHIAPPAIAFPALFSVTLVAGRTAGDLVWIKGARLPSRLTNVTRAGKIQSQPLEGELDAQAATEQELRRDIDAILTGSSDFDAIASGIGNNSTAPGGTVADALSLLDDRLDVAEPKIADLEDRVGVVEGLVANYGTIADLEAAIVPASTDYVRLAGYYAPGDAGAHLRIRDPDGDVTSADGGKWLVAEALLRSKMFGAKCNGTDPDRAAFLSFISAMKTLNRPGRMSTGRHRMEADVFIELGDVFSSGLYLDGDGWEKSTLQFDDGFKLTIGSVTETHLFYGAFKGFSVRGNVADALVRFGQADFSDNLNELDIEILAGNNSSNAAAAAIELNNVLNADIIYVANGGGDGIGGDGLRLRQARFNRFFGSCGNCVTGIRLKDGFSYGNSFSAVDIEVCTTGIRVDNDQSIENVWQTGTIAGVVNCFDFRGANVNAKNKVENFNLSSYTTGVLNGVGLLLDYATPAAAGNTSLTLDPLFRYFYTSATLTAPRTWTMMPAKSMGAGSRVKIRDVFGGVSSVNTLTIARGGSDTIDGGTSTVIANAYGGVEMETDGNTRWTVVVAGVAQGGTGATTAAGARANLGAVNIAGDTMTGLLTLSGNPVNALHAATKQYVDGIVAAQDAMVFKGVIDCSANPNYPAADRGWTYRVSVAGKIGGASGVNVEGGDILICLTDGTASGDQATVGTSWGVIQTNIDGAVTLTGTQTLTNKTLTDPVISRIIGGAAAGSDLTFQTTTGVGSGDDFIWNAGNNGATERMRLTATGLGVGTNNPAQTIHGHAASGTAGIRLSVGAGTAEGVFDGTSLTFSNYQSGDIAFNATIGNNVFYANSSEIFRTQTATVGLKFSNARNFSANGSVATVLGSLGPVGSHTAVQEWLSFFNASGVQRWVPCF